MAAINYLVGKIGSRPPPVKEMTAPSYATRANYSAISDITSRANPRGGNSLTPLVSCSALKKKTLEWSCDARGSVFGTIRYTSPWRFVPSINPCNYFVCAALLTILRLRNVGTSKLFNISTNAPFWTNNGVRSLVLKKHNRKACKSSGSIISL